MPQPLKRNEEIAEACIAEGYDSFEYMDKVAIAAVKIELDKKDRECDARVLGAFSLTKKHIIELNTIALSDKHFRQIVLKYLRNCLKTN